MKKDNNLRILIIGASGFLGSKLFTELSRKYNVVGTYYSDPTSDLSPLDIKNRKDVKNFLSKSRPDILIDCGGITRPDTCEVDQLSAYKTNIEGVGNLVEYSNCKLIYFSTDYVFDGKKGKYTENDEPNPINYYGWTKLEAEKIVLAYKLDNVVLRVSGLYGKNNRNNEFLLSLMKPIIYKATDCFSSNLLLDDLVQHISYFWSKSGLYHITNGNALSRFKFTLKAVNILGFSSQVVGKCRKEIYTIAERPKDCSLVSVRHNLPVHNEESGLLYLKNSLNSHENMIIS